MACCMAASKSVMTSVSFNDFVWLSIKISLSWLNEAQYVSRVFVGVRYIQQIKLRDYKMHAPCIFGKKNLGQL